MQHCPLQQPRSISKEDEDELESDSLSDLSHFSALALQLLRLVTLHSTNEIKWEPPHRLDPYVRAELFDTIAIAINDFGGDSALGTMKGSDIGSLYTTLQSFNAANHLPVAALPLASLKQLCDRVWSPPCDSKKTWADSLHRLACTAALLGSCPPSHPDSVESSVPSSWLVWRLDKTVTPADVVDACHALGVSGPVLQDTSPE